MHLRRPGSHVVGDGQRARPFLRNHFAAHRGQQRLRIFVRDWQYRDLLNHLALADGEALGIFGGADAWRERIARIISVLDASALYSVFRAVGPFWEYVAGNIAIVGRIGVDDAALGSMLIGDFRLDTAPAASVTRNHDRALYRNAHAIELIVVIAHAVVHIDQRAGYVSVGGVGVVGRKLLLRLARGRIARDRRLLQLGAIVCGRDQFKHALFGRGKENVKGLNLRVEAPRLELGQHPLGVVFVIR